MKIQTYNDIDIKVLSQTENASHNMKLACDVTQKKDIDLHGTGYVPMTDKLAKFLISAEHTSVFEHGSMTFLASGISRALLAQVTRQRMWSFTSASQHYQDYRDYPMSIRPNSTLEPQEVYEIALGEALGYYSKLIELGEKPEEARQVLPNACTVNLQITANPRSLVEFLIVRKCLRNTEEMRIFAEKLHIICQAWIPELFSQIGPYCTMHDNKCNQGIMSCRK